ncbi:hypothetical protein BDF14DRAFT_1859862 [Spinellus fusiger]|nr:hypothetical protein BDF14DRAFT_1859862 [Spinellus fusiger]
MAEEFPHLSPRTSQSIGRALRNNKSSVSTPTLNSIAKTTTSRGVSKGVKSLTSVVPSRTNPPRHAGKPFRLNL